MSEEIVIKKGVELDKRFYLPGVVVRSKCPECGKERKVDFKADYLSYPKTGVPEEVYFCCEDEKHCAEWVGAVITVQVVAHVETR